MISPPSFEGEGLWDKWFNRHSRSVCIIPHIRTMSTVFVKLFCTLYLYIICYFYVFIYPVTNSSIGIAKYFAIAISVSRSGSVLPFSKYETFCCAMSSSFAIRDCGNAFTARSSFRFFAKLFFIVFYFTVLPPKIVVADSFCV